MEKNNWPTIIIIMMVIAIVAGGGIYLWQNQEIKSAPLQKVEAGQETRSLSDCSKLDSSWALFSNDKTSLSFCYKKSWGTPELKETEIDPVAKVGTVFYISFSEAVNSFPLISYSTLDFQKLGDSDTPPVIDWNAFNTLDWNALTIETSDSEIAQLFPNENAGVQKDNLWVLTVDNLWVLKVRRDFVSMSGPATSFDYFQPSVVINGTKYNLHIVGSPEQEADLDKLLASITFQAATVYTNSEYGFTLMFPEIWSTIEERKQENGEKIHAAFQLVSVNDPGRFIKIQVVKNEDKNDPVVIDFPQKYLTENSTYSYYYTTDTEAYPNSEQNEDPAMQNEIKEIVKTFSLIEGLTKPLSYSTTGVSATVYKEISSFGYMSDQLVSMADECGNEQTASYFSNLLSKFSSETKIVYNFFYNTGDSQGSDTFRVTLVPNKAGYTSLDEFKKDFDQCYAGGDAYPKMLNDDWLLFVNSCGTGFDDGSGRSVGCQEIRDVVESTLELN